MVVPMKKGDVEKGMNRTQDANFRSNVNYERNLNHKLEKMKRELHELMFNSGSEPSMVKFGINPDL